MQLIITKKIPLLILFLCSFLCGKAQVEACNFIPSLWNFKFLNHEGEKLINEASLEITETFESVLTRETWFKQIINRKDISAFFDKAEYEQNLTGDEKNRIPLVSPSNVFIDGYYSLKFKTDRQNGIRVSYYLLYIEVQGFDGTIYTKLFETFDEYEWEDPDRRTEKVELMLNNTVSLLKEKCGDKSRTVQIKDSVNIGLKRKGINIKDDLVKQLALRKAKELGSNIRLIGDKEVAEHQKDTLIQLTLQLFQDKTCSIEVSSKRRKRPTVFTIEEYLNRLRRLSYKKISIEWIKLGIVEEFRAVPGEKGLYEGVIRAVQRFEGYQNVLMTIEPTGPQAFFENQLVYEDETTKDIQTYIKINEVYRGPSPEDHVEILFCEMKVVQTK